MTASVAARADLEAEGLVVDRGATPVLRGVDVSLRPRELVAVLGPNGAGKSTLLLALSGVVPLRRGSVYAKGRRIDGLPAERIARLGIALVPQGRHLFRELTVRENLRLARFARRRGVEPHPPELWAEHFPQIARHLDAPAGVLSGGQQQLVALARGLSCRPDVVLCDEPTASLSPGARAAVLTLLRSLADSGAVVLVVEQEVDAVLEVADRAIIMRAGKVAMGVVARA